MKPKYFLYVGNAYPHKNLNRLIGAMVLLNKTQKERILLKISSSRNVFTERLEKAIKKYGAQKYVELLGFTPDAKLPALYRNSVAFVFPTLSEGFGLPGLEAMKAGTLVLAANIPVLREVYRNNAAFFDPYDPKSMVEVMKQALNMGVRERRWRIDKSQKFAKRY